jgi:CubicO group peptidase (beta-lactamase class C family)
LENKIGIVLINENKTEWAKSNGVIKVESRVPVTKESFFEAASTTKMLVAATALHFVEKGLLDLDASFFNLIKFSHCLSSSFFIIFHGKIRL